MMYTIPPALLRKNVARVVRGVLNHYGFCDGKRFNNDYAGDKRLLSCWYEVDRDLRNVPTTRRRGFRPHTRAPIVHPDVGPILCSVRGRMCEGDCEYCPWGSDDPLPDDMSDMAGKSDLRLGAPYRCVGVYCYSRRELEDEILSGGDFAPYDDRFWATVQARRWAAGLAPIAVERLTGGHAQMIRSRALWVVDNDLPEHKVQLVAISRGYAGLASVGMVLDHCRADAHCTVDLTADFFGEAPLVYATE